MLSLFGEPSRRRFLLDTAIPILAVALLLNLLCAGLLYWSTKRADKASLERQQDLVELVLSRLVEGVAHDQESVTVWDDALNALREPGGKAWIEANLGSWMYTYFGHDASFIVDPDGELVLSSAGGKPADRSAFEAITHAASPLIQELRQKLADGNRGDISGRVLTPGAADISTVNGRPAAVSVKPIVSDSGQINIQPGREYLHVALRYIDKELVEELRADYLINGLRFAWTDDAVDGEVASRLRALGGEAVGYFIWIPYRPGSTVRAYMLPMLVALCGLSLLALTLLLGGLRRRSLTLLQSQEEISTWPRTTCSPACPTGQSSNGSWTGCCGSP